MEDDDGRQPGPLALLRAGAAAVHARHAIAVPLAALFGLLSVLLVLLTWPWLEPPPDAGAADRLLPQLALTAVQFCMALGFAILWARVLLLGPEQGFAGGWPDLLRRWRRSLAHAALAVLVGMLLTMPAILLGGFLGLLLTVIFGSAGSALQAPVMMLVIVAPVLLIAAALWLTVMCEAVDRPVPFAVALQRIMRSWSAVLPFMLLAFGVTLSAYGLALFIAGDAERLDLASPTGEIAQFIAAVGEIGFVLLVLPGLAYLSGNEDEP